MEKICNKYIIFLFLFAFYTPDFVSTGVYVDLLQRGTKLILAAAVAIVYLKKRDVHNGIVNCCIAIESIYIISTIIHKSFVCVLYAGNQAVTVVATTMLLSLCIHYDAKSMLKVINIYFFLNCIINSFMALVEYGAGGTAFWLGGDNSSIQYYILSITLSSLAAKTRSAPFYKMVSAPSMTASLLSAHCTL